MTNCGGSCVDLQTDRHHCGECSQDCTTLANVVGSETTCANGICQLKCDLLHGDCDGNPDNGCETGTTTNARCGSCSTTCTAPAQCGLSNGVYACRSCKDRGLIQCGGQCVDGATDANNCGACGVKCPGGTCQGGKCTSCVVTASDIGGVALASGNTGFAVQCPNMAVGKTVSVSFSGSMCLAGGQNSPWIELGLDATGNTCSYGPTCYTQANWGSVTCTPSISLSTSSTVPSNGIVHADMNQIRCQGNMGGSDTCNYSGGSEIKFQVQ